MTAPGLRPSGRLGLSPKRRRPSTPPTAAADIAILRDRGTEVSADSGGSFETPAAVVLDPGDHAGPLGHAELDVMSTLIVDSALPPIDQPKPIRGATATGGA